MSSQRTRDKQQETRVLEFPPLLHPHIKTPITHWFRSDNQISYTGKPLNYRTYFKAVFLQKLNPNLQQRRDCPDDPQYTTNTRKEDLSRG
jgi:hypothetical protein